MMRPHAQRRRAERNNTDILQVNREHTDGRVVPLQSSPLDCALHTAGRINVVVVADGVLTEGCSPGTGKYCTSIKLQKAFCVIEVRASMFFLNKI